LNKSVLSFFVCEFIKHTYPNLPLVIYANKNLKTKEIDKLKTYTDSIILKTINSEDRMLSEVDLFLNKVQNKETLEVESQSDVDLGELEILVVDDDIKNIFVLDTLLSEHNAVVQTAKNELYKQQKMEK